MAGDLTRSSRWERSSSAVLPADRRRCDASVMPTLSRLGLGRLVPTSSRLPAAVAARVTAITSTSQAYRNQRDEISVIPEVFAQARVLTRLGDRPLGVLTTSENRVRTKGWAAAPNELIALSGNQPRTGGVSLGSDCATHPERAVGGRCGRSLTKSAPRSAADGVVETCLLGSIRAEPRQWRTGAVAES